ncbi:hypothetical protein GCM10023066_27150 [Nocardioides kongjuensis]
MDLKPYKYGAPGPAVHYRFRILATGGTPPLPRDNAEIVAYASTELRTSNPTQRCTVDRTSDSSDYIEALE